MGKSAFFPIYGCKITKFLLINKIFIPFIMCMGIKVNLFIAHF